MYGVSFSLKYAREMGVSPKACLTDALKDLGVRRLRLMSYWDLHEPKRGTYDFTELDWQFALAKKYGAKVSLAIGLRQPRWPESHWPKWSLGLPKEEWHRALYKYIETVIKRYKDHPSLISWQLENEAMLKTFGQNGDFERSRLKTELQLVKRLDAKHPIIMTCSDSWGIPLLGPKPDMYAFSVYRYFYDRGAYRRSSRPAICLRVRALLIRLVKRRKVFIHELQAEPWGSVGTSKMTIKEQNESMNLARVQEAVEFARKSQLYPIDIWGLEWWYWLKVTHNKPSIWNYVHGILK